MASSNAAPARPLGRWSAAMAFGASAAYVDLLQAFLAHPNTQGGMWNAGMPLAIEALAATAAFGLLSVAVDLSSTRLGIGSPPAAAFAGTAALIVFVERLQGGMDRFAPVRFLLPAFIASVFAVVVYRGLANLARTRTAVASTAPLLLGTTALLTWLAHRRVIGAVGLTVLLSFSVATLVVIGSRRRSWPSLFVAVPWVATLLAPLLDWTPAVPTLRTWSTARVVSGAERHPGTPDVLLVTVDALRADALPLHGGKAATPALDRLVAHSYVFDQAFAPAPWTLPSMASLFTGVDPSVHAVAGLLTPIPRRLVTLAEVLRGAGYHTAAFGAGNALLAEPEREFWRGFDTFEFASAPLPATMWASRFLPRLLPNTYAGKLSATEFVPRVRARFDARRGNTFTWVHLFDTHSAYRSHGPGPRREFGALEEIQTGLWAPTDAEKRDIRSLYDGEVEEMDRGLGLLLDGLEKSGRYDSTLIVFLSDHGEEFWDHGSIGHGRSLYQDQVRVPLLVKLPWAHDGIRVAAPTSTTRVAATILEVVGRPGAIAGRSLSAEWRREQGAWAGDGAVLSSMALTAEDPRRSVTFGAWTYIRVAADGREELYDLRCDPQQRDSQAQARPVELQRGRELLAAAESDALRARRALGLSRPVTREIDPILRSMGYVQ